MAGFLESLGFNQTAPNGMPQDSPSLTELIARLAANLAPASHFIGGTRTPMGRALGAASLFTGLGAGSIADQLQAQRNDPVARQLAMANYIQQQGTAPTTANLAPYRLPAPPNATTTLTPEDESKFQNWYSAQAQKTGLNPNPDDPAHQYDYRAAFKAGVQPGPDGHWPSTFKMAGHPNRIVNGVDTVTGLPATSAAASAMNYTPVAAGQPSGFPGPRQGAAAFNVENLPPALSMVAQKLYPKLDPSEALKDEELKARTAYLQRQGNAPLAVPTGTELRDATGTTVIAPARLTEAQQQMEHNNALYRGYAADVAAYQQAHPEMDRLQAADAVLNDPNKGYGELPETYGLVKSAKEWRTEQFKNKSEMEKERFAQQQQNGREAFSQSENNRRFERELSTRDAPGLYADKTTGEIRKVTRGELASDMNSKDKNFKSVLPTEAATVDLLKNATPMIDRMEELVPKVLAKNKGKQLGTVIQNYAAHKMGYDPDLQELLQIGTALSAEQARALGGSSRVLGSMFSAIRGESIPGIGVTAETAKRQLQTGRKEINNRIKSITGQPLEKLGPDQPPKPGLPGAPPSPYYGMSNEDFLKAKPR